MTKTCTGSSKSSTNGKNLIATRAHAGPSAASNRDRRTSHAPCSTASALMAASARRVAQRAHEHLRGGDLPAGFGGVQRGYGDLDPMIVFLAGGLAQRGDPAEEHLHARRGGLRQQQPGVRVVLAHEKVGCADQSPQALRECIKHLRQPVSWQARREKMYVREPETSQ